MVKLNDTFTKTGRLKRGIVQKSEDAKQTKPEAVAELLKQHGLRPRSFAPTEKTRDRR